MNNDFPDSLIVILPPQSQQVIRSALHEIEDAWIEQQAVSQSHGSELKTHLDRSRDFQRRERALAAPLPPMPTAELERLRAQRAKELGELESIMASEQIGWRKRDLALKARLETFQERWRSFDWLESARSLLHLVARSGQDVQYVGWPAAKLRRGQSWHEALNASRAELAKLDEEAQAVRSAPAPADDLKRRIEHEVNRVARRGAPWVDFRRRSTSDPIPLLSNGAFHAETLAWLFRDEVLSRLFRMVDEADLSNALSDEERDQALSLLATRRLEAERREEGIIRAAREAGEAFLRRSDADPRAVLGVAD